MTPVPESWTTRTDGLRYLGSESQIIHVFFAVYV